MITFKLLTVITSYLKQPNNRQWIRKVMAIPLLFLLFGLQCSFDDPVLPSWTVPVNVPLAKQTFKLGEELVNDSTIIAQGPDSMLFLSFDGELDTLELTANDFSIPGLDTTHEISLGALELDSLDMLSTGPLALRRIFPSLEALTVGGYTIPVTIPDTTIMPPAEELDTGDFVALHLTSGALRIHFVNNLPFPIGPNSSQPDGLQITVYDSLQNQVLRLAIDEVINPGMEIEKVSSIANGGTWIYSPLKIEYIIPIAQQTTFQLSTTVLDTTSIEIGVALENLVADEVIAKLQTQEWEDNLAVPLENENRLKNAVIERGAINLRFINETEIGANVDFTLPNCITPQSTPLSGSLQIPRNGTETLNLNLDGMSITNPTEFGAFVDSLRINYHAKTKTEQSLVHVTSADRILIEIKIDSLFFKSFSGFLAADTFEISPFEEDSLVDYKDISNNIRFDDVNLDLAVSNEVFIENMLVDLNISGYHKEHGVVTDSAVITLTDQQIYPGQPGQPEISHINLSGAEVADFLNILPNAIRSSGRVKASGNVEIFQNSRVGGSYAFSLPLKFNITDDAYLEGDLDTLDQEDIDEDLQRAADESLQEATLTMEVVNSTPMSGSLYIYVSRDSSHNDLYDSTGFNPELEFVKEITILPAPTDPNSGYVTEPQRNEIVVTLNHDEIHLFKNPPLKFGYKLRIAGTNGTVALRASDFVQVSGLARFVVNVKDD